MLQTALIPVHGNCASATLQLLQQAASNTVDPSGRGSRAREDGQQSSIRLQVERNNTALGAEHVKQVAM
jgi:hypothetical protein